jgi:hypothetical protein
MRNHAVGISVVALTGGLLAGCGGGKASPQPPDGSAGNGHVDTSVGTDQPLAALSPTDFMQLCTDVTPGFVSITCNGLGIAAARATAFDTTVTDADLKAACRSAAEDCQSRGGAGQPDCASMDTPPSGATCTATVGDYVACVNASVDALPTCSDVTRAFLADDSTVPEPSACVALDRACPALAATPAAGFVGHGAARAP